MTPLFYSAAAIALFATAMAISRPHIVHALLYFICSLLSVAVAMYALGAPFVAALEVMIYAGAIMVLFVFVVMLLNVGPGGTGREREWLEPRNWLGPGLLAGAVGVHLLLVLSAGQGDVATAEVGVKAVGTAMFGPYLLAVELASMLLLAGLVAAYHIGKQR